MNSRVLEAMRHLLVVDDTIGGDMSSSALSRQCARGELTRLGRGIYLPSELARDLTPSVIYETRTRAVASRGILRQPLSRSSAAAVWGVPLLHPRPNGLIDALGWDSRSTRTSGDIRYWASSSDDSHVVMHDGVRLTDVPRTLAELCLSESFATAVVAVDWAIRVRHRDAGTVTTLDDIRGVADELGFRRGRARLERVLSFADGQSESPGESWARVLVQFFGFEAPELQHEYRFADGSRSRSDFRWASISLAGEFDGLSKYKSAELRAGRTAEEVVVEEKLREDAIRASGDGMVRIVWGHLRAPSWLVALLEGAGVPRDSRRARQHS